MIQIRGSSKAEGLIEEALRRIENGAGTQFDPALAETFLAHFEEIIEPVLEGQLS